MPGSRQLGTVENSLTSLLQPGEGGFQMLRSQGGDGATRL